MVTNQIVTWPSNTKFRTTNGMVAKYNVCTLEYSNTSHFSKYYLLCKKIELQQSSDFLEKKKAKKKKKKNEKRKEKKNKFRYFLKIKISYYSK